MDALNHWQIFRERAEAVQVVVEEITDLAAACRYVAEVTSRQGGATIAAPGWDAATIALLKEICQLHQIEVLTDNLRQQAERLHTGFTLADWGIAATGTLVHESSSEDLRLATMLCETHIAVLPLSRLKPEVEALAEELNGLMHSPPRYLSFITGASRTADIERVLALGVHGPLELQVLLLQD